MNELETLITTTYFNKKYWENALRKKSINNVKFKVIENTAGEIFETYDESLEKKVSDTLTIGFAGRYTDWKNWPLAIEIVKKLNVELKDRLYVKMAVGCLDEKAEKATKRMFDLLERMLGNRFSGKINVNLSEMNKFYYNIDIFILTSKYNTESFGRTLVEAMSRKKIVLTTNAGGSVEVVGNQKNVCDTADEFKNRILELFNNEELMKNEKEMNFIRVKNKYSLKNNIDKHKELYYSLLTDST